LFGCEPVSILCVNSVYNCQFRLGDRGKRLIVSDMERQARKIWRNASIKRIVLNKVTSEVDDDGL